MYMLNTSWCCPKLVGLGALCLRINAHPTSSLTLGGLVYMESRALRGCVCRSGCVAEEPTRASDEVPLHGSHALIRSGYVTSAAFTSLFARLGLAWAGPSSLLQSLMVRVVCRLLVVCFLGAKKSRHPAPFPAVVDWDSAKSTRHSSRIDGWPCIYTVYTLFR